MGEFIYEKGVAPCGVAVEMIYGADEKSAKVWKLFAMQIFSEATEDYREIGHYENGAPLLCGISQRISVSHTSHCLLVASLPKTPDISLDKANVRTALGIDLEKRDREQVLKIRDRFLTEEEIGMIQDHEMQSEEMTERYILAWTCKEALYKAGMGDEKDWKNDYRILRMPEIASSMREAVSGKYGEGEIKIDGEPVRLSLSSWEMEGHIVTLAFSGKIPKFAFR